MKIFDTMRKKKVELETLEKGKVKIYLCGPTVYDYGHLGHGRSVVVFDLLRRFLEYTGYRVTFVRNWTDIDDKTIDRAKKEGTTVEELTSRFIQIYKEDFEKLNIKEPDYDPKPTDHIDEIIDMIKKLFEQGHAYILKDGVYYDISTFPDYGMLSGQNLKDLREGARVDVQEGKRNPGDFVLWKFEKQGEPSWPSPWGKGRPGWHIECSAMSVKCLGSTFDIHCGGQDLTFPHHEDEIAQAKGAGYEFARYWMHNAFLIIDNEKMSKSLGNFFTLRQIFEKYHPSVVRFFLFSAHYRDPLNFSEESLKQARSALERYNDFIIRVQGVIEKGIIDTGRFSTDKKLISGCKGNFNSYQENVESLNRLIEEARIGFRKGLEDDLNISQALASLSEFMRNVNTLIDVEKLTSDGAKKVIDFFKEINIVLGVFRFERGLLPGDIEALIEQRAKARKEKNYKEADRIRNLLLEKGIVLEDTKEGTRWKQRV